MSDTPLSGQIALVTGASSGIGAATAARLARAGADVAINVHPSDDGDDVAERVREHGRRVVVIPADVGDEDEVGRMFGRIADELGPLGICVSNAGIQQAAPFVDTSFDSWRQQLAVNLDATFLVGRAAARAMAGRGGGVIINVTSVHEHTTFPDHAPYCAAKAGAGMLTRCMARELASEGIRVLAVAPGAILSGANEDSDGEGSQSGIPAGRLGRPEEVAELICFLATPAAVYVSGTSIVIDGALEQEVSTR